MRSFAIVLTLGLAASASAVEIPVKEDVMTSAFFTGDDLVRGFPGDNRPTFRVSTDNAFGLTGAETIYLTFDYDFAAQFTAPVAQALLTVTSVNGGFNGDATPENPFTVSAHGVNADPIASILDNTNPTGTIDWLSFYQNNILPADAAARTVVTGFGTYTFDVTALVNSWVAGTNPVHAIALTGKNDASGNDFLHGFRNNNNNATGTPDGFSVLNVTVPEPTTVGLLAMGLVTLGVRRRRSR